MKAVVSLLFRVVLFFTLFNTVLTEIYAQFEVVLVKGEVYRNNGKEKLKIGEKVNRDEKFDFKSANAIIAIYNSQVGRILLPEREDGAGAMGGQAPKLRDKYGMVVKDLNRAIDANLFLSNNPVIDFGTIFNEMNGAQQGTITNAKLFVRFDYENKTIYNQIGDLAPDSSMIIPIARHQIYRTQNGEAIDIKKIESHTEIVMLCNDNKDTVYLRTFNPMYIDNQEGIKKEVRVILNANQAVQKNNTETFAMVRHYIAKYYGTPNDKDLSIWLKENFSFIQ